MSTAEAFAAGFLLGALWLGYLWVASLTATGRGGGRSK